MKNIFWSFVRRVVGVVLIIAGIFGLFLPFLQGVLIIVFGLVLLGVDVDKRRFKSFADRLRGRR